MKKFTIAMMLVTMAMMMTAAAEAKGRSGFDIDLSGFFEAGIPAPLALHASTTVHFVSRRYDGDSYVDPHSTGPTLQMSAGPALKMWDGGHIYVDFAGGSGGIGEIVFGSKAGFVAEGKALRFAVEGEYWLSDREPMERATVKPSLWFQLGDQNQYVIKFMSLVFQNSAKEGEVFEDENCKSRNEDKIAAAAKEGRALEEKDLLFVDQGDAQAYTLGGLGLAYHISDGAGHTIGLGLNGWFGRVIQGHEILEFNRSKADARQLKEDPSIFILEAVAYYHF